MQPSFAWRLKEPRGISIQSSEMKSTGSQEKQCAIPLSTHRRSGSKWKSGMTNGSFGCGSEMMGGKLAVWSELDSGTEVELSIPASRAYETSPARRRSRLAEMFSGKDTDMKS